MRLHLRVDAAVGPVDVEVTLAEGVTLGELAGAVGLTTGDAVLVDGRPLPSGATVAAVGVVDGSVLGAGPPTAPDGTAGCDVLQLDGLDAGRRWSFPPGRRRLGPPGAALHLDVGRGGAAVLPYGAPDLTVGTAPVHRAVDPGDEWITAGGRRFRLTPPSGTRSPEAPTDGARVLRRPPRRPPGGPPAPVVVPDPPDAPSAAQPMSWTAVAAPLPVGIAMALLVDPRFLLFSAMSPLMALGRWVEGRVRRRRDARRHAAALAGRAATIDAAVDAAARHETVRRRRCHPDLATLVRAAETGGPDLWLRRIAGDDALVTVAGTACVPYRPATTASGAGTGVAEGVEPVRVIGPVPLTVETGVRGCVGVAGPRPAALAVARSLLLQATVLHGPADLSTAVLTSADRASVWDWTKWLPHGLDGDRPGVALDPADAAALLATGRRAAATLLVVDDDGRHLGEDGRDTHRTLADPDRAVGAVVVAEQVAALPALCATVLAVETDGRLRIHRLGPRRDVEIATAVGASQAVAERAARAMAGWRDPEVGASAVPLPAVVRLRELLDHDAAVAAGADPVDAVAARWSASTGRGSLRVPLGVTEDGALHVDLVADGPHALVAGTTGAGKSELLRSWVAGLAASAGPDRVNFVLVDFKGGGAFDRCAELPHTVGVVTDLDEHLAERALRCLRAELRHREARLRTLGVSDLADLTGDVAGGPLPRLVVVIDEFATVVAELPEFVSSLVDVAQRGRSLGIHLVLATQRPQGVIDAKIRANVDLRIALRVLDDADSLDVVGTTAAATVPRRRPGRGHARLAAGEVIAFQAALVSTGGGAAAGRRRVAVEPFRLVGPPLDAAPDGSGDERGCGDDLAGMVAATRAAHERRGGGAPRVPWPEPLPDRLDAIDLEPPTGGDRWVAPLGIADLPDEQRRAVRHFDAGAGNLLVYGVDRDGTTQVLVTVAVGLARSLAPDRFHLYLVDAVGGALAPLGALGHCGAHVGVDDPERLERVLDRLDTELARRRALVAEHRLGRIGPATRIAGRPLPLVVVAVAGYGALLERCEEERDQSTSRRLHGLVRDGPALGVVVVASASHARAVPLRVADRVAARLVMRLADETSYATLGLAPRRVPPLPPGRAVEPDTGTEVQVGAYAGGDVAGAAQCVPARPDRDHLGPAPVPELPGTLGWADLDPSGHLGPTGLSLPVGLDVRRLVTARLVLRPGEHAIVAGPPASGKSTVLGTLAAAAAAVRRTADGPVRVVTVAAASSPLAAAPADARIRPGDVGAQWPDGGDDGDPVPTLVLVDDADHLAPDVAAGLQALVDARRPGLHVVAAGRPDGLRGFQSWTQALRPSRTGIALRASPGDADLFRTTFGPPGSGPAPDGRGHLVSGGVVATVQFAAATPTVNPAARSSPRRRPADRCR